MDELIKTLKERRAKVTQQWRSYVEDAEARSEWGAVEQATDKRYQDDLVEIEQRLADLEETRAKNLQTERYMEDNDLWKLVGTFGDSRTESRAVNDFFEGRASTLGVELDFSQRGLQTNTSTGNQAMPVLFHRQLADYLVEESAILGLARVFPVEAGSSMDVPKISAYGTAVQIVAEGTAIGEDDPDLAKLNLKPVKYAGITYTSHEFNSSAGINVRELIARDHGVQVGGKAGIDFAVGNGSGKPLGLFSGSSYGTASQGTASVIEPDQLITTFFSVAPGYQRNGTWLMRNSTLAAIRKFKDGDGRYLIDINSGLSAGAPVELLGRPVEIEAGAPAVGSAALSVGFGDISRAYAIGASPMRFEFSDEFKFDQDLRTWRSAVSFDGKPYDLRAWAMLDTD